MKVYNTKVVFRFCGVKCLLFFSHLYGAYGGKGYNGLNLDNKRTVCMLINLRNCRGLYRNHFFAIL